MGLSIEREAASGDLATIIKCSEFAQARIANAI
jgi:hypothetical protein